MFYVLLAVIFYTTVRFGTQLWINWKYEKSEAAKVFGLGHDIRELRRRVDELEKK